MKHFERVFVCFSWSFNLVCLYFKFWYVENPALMMCCDMMQMIGTRKDWLIVWPRNRSVSSEELHTIYHKAAQILECFFWG